MEVTKRKKARKQTIDYYSCMIIVISNRNKQEIN